MTYDKAKAGREDSFTENEKQRFHSAEPLPPRRFWLPSKGGGGGRDTTSFCSLTYPYENDAWNPEVGSTPKDKDKSWLLMTCMKVHKRIYIVLLQVKSGVEQ